MIANDEHAFNLADYYLRGLGGPEAHRHGSAQYRWGHLGDEQKKRTIIALVDKLEWRKHSLFVTDDRAKAFVAYVDGWVKELGHGR